MALPKAARTETNVIPEPKVSFDDLLVPASEFRGSNSTNVLVIGIPNSKKTFSLNTIPNTWIPWGETEERPFRVLYLNADNRAAVIDWQNRPNWSVINLPLEYSNPEEIVKLHKDVLDNLKRSWDIVTHHNKRFDCVIYDSLTPLSENMSNFTWSTVQPGERGKGNDKTTVAKWSSGYEGNEDRYGTVSHFLKMFILGLRDSVQFFFAIAHEKKAHYSDKDQTTRADVAGGVKRLLNKFFQEVYYTQMNRGEWSWLTQTYNNCEARTCYPVPMFLPMDWSIIINRRWKEFYDEQADADYKAAKLAEAEQEREEVQLALARAKAAEQEGGD